MSRPPSRTARAVTGSPSPTQTCTQPDPSYPTFCTTIPDDSSGDPVFVEHALTGHSHFDYGLDAQALAFGVNDPGNGYVLAPQARYAWKTSAR